MDRAGGRVCFLFQFIVVAVQQLVEFSILVEQFKFVIFEFFEFKKLEFFEFVLFKQLKLVELVAELFQQLFKLVEQFEFVFIKQ